MKYRAPPSTRRPLAGALTAAFLLSGCGGDAVAPEPTPSLTVTTTAPLALTVDRVLVVSGSVAAWQEVSLGVELSGNRVADVLVEVGDRVRKGQPLLRLDSRSLAVEARQTEAALLQAQANLALARGESERGALLLTRGLISNADNDQLKANLIRAEAQLSTAEADRDAAQLNLGFATLVAPHAGVISARSVQPGTVVTSGTELLRLIRDGRLEWRADLSERDFTRVREGTAVELTAPDGSVVRGTVRTVSPSIDAQTRTGLVYADLPQPGPLRAGMFAQGRVVFGSGTGTVLPREAIVYRDGIPYIYVVDDGKARDPKQVLVKVRQQRVGIGAQQGDYLEVTTTLATDERIAVRGAGFLNDGDLVRLAPQPAVAAAPAQP